MFRPEDNPLNRGLNGADGEHNGAPRPDALPTDALSAEAMSAESLDAEQLLADRQSADLLARTLAAPAPDAAFVDSLGERLQTEFAIIHAGLYQVAEEDAPEEEGNDAAVISIETGRRAEPAPRRWWTVAAASLLVGMIVWSAQPSYTFAGMLDAVRQQQWVRSELLQAGVIQIRRWVSAEWVRGEGGVAAEWVRAEHGTAGTRYADHARGEVLFAAPDGEQIVKDQLPSDQPGDAANDPSNNTNWLLRDLLGDDADQWRPINEDWRRGGSYGGRDDLIELDVAFQSPTGDRASVRFLVDPSTRLPLMASRLGTASAGGQLSNKGAEVRFGFTDNGPQSIYDLGADRQLPIVDSPRIASRGGRAGGEVSLRPGRASGAGAGDGALAPRQLVDPTPKTDAEQTPAPRQQVNSSENINTIIGTGEDAAAEAEPVQGGADVESVEIGEWQPLPATPDAPPMGDAELTAHIDALLRRHWAAEGVEPVGPASDEELLRRMQLDLTGRIPTVGEVRLFLEDTAPGRRERLVDKLLTSRDHATHFASLWRRSLIPRSIDLQPYGGPTKLEEWLADHMQRNTSHSEVARQLLMAEGRLSESGPLLFYAALKLNPEELAAQTARTFLGMRLECAECHDHPFDDRISQEDFWAFAANFARIARPKGMIESTPDILRVRDVSRGEATLPDTDNVVPPGLPLTDRPVHDAEGWPSRREQMTNWITAPSNPRFARATVNRVWSHLFGLPLVDPIDDIRADSDRRVPDVLDAVAEDFARSGFDLRRLVRCLVMTEAYQLSSESADAPTEENTDGADLTEVFARMNLKPFTAEQLYDAIVVASRSAAANRGMASGGLVRFGDSNRDAFIQLFESPDDQAIDYQAGIPQALTLMHGQLIHGATDVTTSGMLQSLAAPFFTDRQRVETLFLATLSRKPTDAERQAMEAHVARSNTPAGRQQKLGDVLWALLNSAEFTLNH